MIRIGLKGLSLLFCGVFLLAGCRDTGETYKKSQTRSEAPEYDCRIHSKDKICEVPQKDGKVMLYCYKGPWPHVVRSRWECK